MYPAGVLSVLVTATTGQANASLRKTQTMFRATAATSETAAARSGAAWKKAGFVVAAGTAFAAAASSKAAIDFEKSMRNVNSLAQLPEPQFKKLSDSVRELAGPTAQAPNALAEGMYDLVSSGFDAQESLTIVKQAAYAATAGLTDAKTSTKAVAAVLNAYRMPATKAKKVSDELFNTVNYGVLTFEELAQHIGDTLPFASSLGVKLAEVGASTATMTKQGLSAPETMTRIRNVMQTLIKPGEDLTKQFEALGMTGEEMIDKFGFQGTLDRLIGSLGVSKKALDDLPSGNLQKLADDTSAAKQEVATLFPNIRALGGVLALTGGNAKEAGKDLDRMKNSTGATSRVFKEQSKSIAIQWQKAKAELADTAIVVGSKLLPVFAFLITALKDVVDGIVSLGGWLGDFNNPASAAITTVLGLAGAMKLVAIVAKSALITSLVGSVTALGGMISYTGIAISEMGILRGAWFGLSAAFAASPIGVTALAVGGLVGAFVGLKAILGGGEGITKLQERIAEGSDRVKDAMDAQATSTQNLKDSSKQLRKAHEEEDQATHQVKKAEDKLAKIRANYPANSQPVLDAEADLVRAKNRENRATDRLSKAERLHGSMKKAAIIDYKDSSLAISNHIVDLRKERKQLKKTLDENIKTFNKTGEGVDDVRESQTALADNTKDLKEQRDDLTVTFGNAQKEIGVKFAGSLEKATGKLIKAGMKSKDVARVLRDPWGVEMRDRVEELESMTDSAAEVGVKVPKNIRKAQIGVHGGIGDLGSDVRKALSALGVKGNIAWPVKQKKKEGGFAVGGHTSGDSVPVNLMLEPGEVGFILNKTATSTLSALKEANSMFPRGRMAAGGMVDPAGPGTGVVNPAIAGVVGAWSQKYNAAINYGYDPGGGHQSPGHNITGTATDTGPAVSWTGSQGALFESGLRAIEGAVDQILYGSHGIGTPYPNHGFGNHAHIEWGMNPQIGGLGSGIGMKIPRYIMGGPGGHIKSLGQAALDKVRDEAQKYIDKQTPNFGEGGEAGLTSAGGAFNKTELMELWTHAGGAAAKANIAAAIALAESGGNPNARNSSGASGLWQILGQVVPGNIFDPLVNAKNAVKKYNDAGGWSPWVVYTEGTYQQYLKHGGLANSEAMMKKLKRYKNRTGDLDEMIDIAERKADLQVSPGGAELSAGEIRKQLVLNVKLMKTLKHERNIAKRGRDVADKTLDRLNHGKDSKLNDLQHKLANLKKRHRQIMDTEKKKKNPNTNATNAVDKDIDRINESIGKRKEEISKNKNRLRELLGGFKETVKEMQGVTGGGGRIFDTRLILSELRHTSPGGLAATGMSVEQLQEFANAVRYGAFDSGIPAFHKGGVVKPPRAGQMEMTALLAKDEGIIDAATMSKMGRGGGDTYVQVEFADGMGWLREFMDVQIKKNDKKADAAFRAGVS